MFSRVPVERAGYISSTWWKMAFDDVYGFRFSFKLPDHSTDTYEVRLDPEYLKIVSERLTKGLRVGGAEENIDLMLRYLEEEDPKYNVLPVEPVNQRLGESIIQNPNAQDYCYMVLCGLFQSFATIPAGESSPATSRQLRP